MSCRGRGRCQNHTLLVHICNDKVITAWHAGYRRRILMRDTHREGAKRDTLNIRIKPEVRGLIDRAAALTGKNRTNFVLDAARHAAEDALLARTVLVLSPKAYADFLARLDAPAQPSERLRRSLQTPTLWEK